MPHMDMTFLPKVKHNTICLDLMLMVADARVNPAFDVELGDPAPASAAAPERDQPSPGSNLQTSPALQTMEPVPEPMLPQLSSNMHFSAPQSLVPKPADYLQSQETLNTASPPPPRRSVVAVEAASSLQSSPPLFPDGRPVVEESVKDNPGIVA